MKSIHLSIGVFLLTLLSCVIYLIKLETASTSIYITCVALLCMLLFFVLRNGSNNSFASRFPTFAFFWCALFVLLPASVRPFESFDSSEMLQLLQSIKGNWQFLLPALAVMVGLGLFSKKGNNILLVVCRYLSTGVIVYAVNSSVAEMRNVRITNEYLLVVPIIVGIYFLCKELNGAIIKKEQPSLLKFFIISILYEAVAMFIMNQTAFEKLFDIASLRYWYIMAAIALIYAGIALYEVIGIKKPENQADEFGYTPNYQLIAILGLLFIATKLLNDVYSSIVLFSGVPVANTVYNFYRAKQLDQFPANQVLAFDWKCWAMLFLGILSLERLSIEMPIMMGLMGAIASAYVLCVLIKNKKENSSVILGFAGVATVTIRYALAFKAVNTATIIICGMLIAFWIALCIYMQKVTTVKSGLFKNEYKWLVHIAKYTPAALFVISSLQYLLKLM